MRFLQKFTNKLYTVIWICDNNTKVYFIMCVFILNAALECADDRPLRKFRINFGISNEKFQSSCKTPTSLYNRGIVQLHCQKSS